MTLSAGTGNLLQVIMPHSGFKDLAITLLIRVFAGSRIQTENRYGQIFFQNNLKFTISEEAN